MAMALSDCNNVPPPRLTILRKILARVDTVRALLCAEGVSRAWRTVVRADREQLWRPARSVRGCSRAQWRYGLGGS